jgi:hypothetical protein
MKRMSMIALAVLLVPTAYGMAVGDFLLAGSCVAGIIALRFLGLRSDDGEQPTDRDGDGHDDE